MRTPVPRDRNSWTLIQSIDRVVKPLVVSFIASVVLAPIASAQETLVLANGDRLSGKLTAINGGSWVFQHPVAGAITIPRAEVLAYETLVPIAVRLADGTVAVGRFEVSGDSMRLVTGVAGTLPVIPADLAAVAPVDDLGSLRPVRTVGRFWPLTRFWRATAGFGFSSTTGNSRSRGFAGDLKIARDTPKDRIGAEFGHASTYSAGPGADVLEKVVEKYYASLRVDVFFSPRFFVFATTKQERDRFQGIDLRSNYQSGLGLQVTAGRNTDLRFFASGGMRREAFVTDSAFGTPVLGAGGAFKQQVGPMELAWTVDWFPRAQVLHDYRAISAASVTTTVFGGLGFRVTSRNELNNNPPSGVEKHDWLLTTALTYTIGR